MHPGLHRPASGHTCGCPSRQTITPLCFLLSYRSLGTLCPSCTWQTLPAPALPFSPSSAGQGRWELPSLTAQGCHVPAGRFRPHHPNIPGILQFLNSIFRILGLIYMHISPYPFCIWLPRHVSGVWRPQPLRHRSVLCVSRALPLNICGKKHMLESDPRELPLGKTKGAEQRCETPRSLTKARLRQATRHLSEPLPLSSFLQV